MHHMITKISTCFIDGETYNISNLNIYYDLRIRQFRHLYFCEKCGVKVGCCCYEHLDQAIQDVENGCLCEACATKEILDDLDVEDIVPHFDEERYSQVIRQGNALVADLLDETLKFFGVSREEVQAGNLDLCLISEILCDTGEYQKLKDFTISLMTEEEKHEEYVETFDYCNALGSACDL